MQPTASDVPGLTLHSQLEALIRRKPVTASPETSLRAALQTMSEERVGSIVIVEPESGKPIGIFTLRDLLHRVAAKSCDLEQWISAVMSDSGLVLLNWRATVYQAALLRARHDVHHVMVVDASGRLTGVVSQNDIYGLQRGEAKTISGAIRNARDMDALIAAAGEIRRLTMQMLADGSGAESLTQLISTLNDHLTVRVIELACVEFSLPEVDWCWLAFGSEGRFEQTFSTDQDNGIIFTSAGGAGVAVMTKPKQKRSVRFSCLSQRRSSSGSMPGSYARAISWPAIRNCASPWRSGAASFPAGCMLPVRKHC